MFKDKTINLLIRFGIGFAFIYPAINALYDPYSWLAYFPKFMRGIIPDTLLLHGFGTIEIIIALWIISGRKIFIPSVVATIILALIVTLNLQDFQIVFRDITILIFAFALALYTYKQNKYTA